MGKRCAKIGGRRDPTLGNGEFYRTAAESESHTPENIALLGN